MNTVVHGGRLRQRLVVAQVEKSGEERKERNASKQREVSVAVEEWDKRRGRGDGRGKEIHYAIH